MSRSRKPAIEKLQQRRLLAADATGALERANEYLKDQVEYELRLASAPRISVDDVVQETILDVAAALDGFEYFPQPGQKAYLQKAAKNHIRNAIRQHRDQSSTDLVFSVMTDFTDPSDVVSYEEQLMKARSWEDQQSPRDKALLQLLQSGYSVTNAAKQLGISRSVAYERHDSLQRSFERSVELHESRM